MTEFIVNLTQYSSFAGGCQNDEFSLNGSSKILNDLPKPLCDGKHHQHNITTNQLILKQHVTPRNDKKTADLISNHANRIMRHKNEMINTCTVQRPAKSMTSRKKLTIPNYMQYN